MQTAAATLAGNALGAGDKKRMNSMAHMCIRIEVILMIFTGTLLYISAPAMMGLFTKSDEVISLGTSVLRMVAISEPCFGISIIILTGRTPVDYKHILHN
jgi:Na+-driven multidrug efflux pump